MSPLAVELIRRVSLLTIALSLALLVIPRALKEFGVLGPRLEDQLTLTERSLQAARDYGGDEADPAFRNAEEKLEESRRLARTGQTWAARLAARRAAEAAVEAQRTALTTRETARRQAALAATEIDRRLNELEDLYTQVTREPGSGGAEKELLPAMKEARRAGAGVLLAIEEGKYARALSMEPDAVVALEGMRRSLKSRQIKDLSR